MPVHLNRHRVADANGLGIGFVMRFLLRALRKQDGVAAIEFALIGGLLSIAALNVADLALYARDRMEVENATSMGAQAAWKACDLTDLPATVNCPRLVSAVTTAVQSTPLGSNVSLKSGYPSEAYYCVNSSGALVYVSDVSTKPSDCSSAGTPSNTPGDYIELQTTFPYAPIFPQITITSVFGNAISQTSWIRVG